MMFKFFYLFLFFIFLFGCFNDNSEEKVISGKGVVLEIVDKNVKVLSEEKMLSANFEITGDVSIEDIEILGNCISVIQKNDNINVYVALIGGEEDNICFRVKNMEKGKISIVQTITKSDEKTLNDFSEKVKKANPKLLGDYNGDGEVNLQDLNVFKQNFGKSSPMYDIAPAAKGTAEWGNIYCIFSGDGIIGLEDLTVFAYNFGKKAPTQTIIEIESISIKISNNNIKEGDSVNITAEIIPSNATNKNIEWSVENSEILEIITITGSETAVINAKKAGKTLINAVSNNGKKDSLEVTINEKTNITGIKIHGKYTHIWAWDKNGVSGNLFATWPGEKMVIEDNVWYQYHFEDAKTLKVILSNSSSGQTGELKITEEGEYWYDGSKLVTYNPDIDTEAPIVELGIKAAKIVDNVNYYEENTVKMTLNIKDNKDSTAKAYYTTNGNNANEGSTEYTANSVIDITDNMILSVYAVDKDKNSAVYNFKFKTGADCTAPVITATPTAGRYETAQNVEFSISDKDTLAKAYYTLDGTEPTENSTQYIKGSKINVSLNTTIKVLGIDNAGNKKTYTFRYYIGEIIAPTREDFREETVYFLMTARFYDGDLSNTRQSPSYESSGNSKYNDPSWRGDFKGLIEKLDYIKALGFTAVWITPPVLNRNYYDYHGYHAWDMTRIDGRLESVGATYQDLINEIHARDMKIMQDIVLNHSGRYGLKGKSEVKYWGDRDDPQWGKDSEINYYDEYNPDFEYDGVSIEPKSGKSWYNGDLWQKEKPEFPWEPADEYYWWNGSTYSHQNDLDNLWGKASPYNSPEGYKVYHFQWPGMYESQFSLLDPEWFHRFWLKNWEDYTCQFGTIHEDCLDLDTESKVVQDYLIDAYGEYIKMGVDAFRIDTVKHISRNTFNRRFNPAFHEIAKQSGKKGFYMAGEVCVRDHGVWNKGNPALSQPFYTWKERTTYSEDDLIAAKEAYDYETGRGADSQPTSDNHLLIGNEYREPDYSQHSGMDVIDFRMHWNFRTADTAFGVKDGDKYTNDATWNLTYVESHDYSPIEVGNSLYARMSDADAMAENWTLMFTWRGIPTIFYGNEILFKGGEIIDEGPNRALEESGRAYFGPHLKGSVQVEDFGVYKNATGEMANTLSHPLAQHLIRLNRIRHQIPALQKGQYSTEDIKGKMAFKRRYTNKEKGIDSFVLVTISGDAVYNNIPNGRYVDVITGDEKEVTNQTLSVVCTGRGNARIYVLDLPNNPAPNKIGEDGQYLK